MTKINVELLAAEHFKNRKEKFEVLLKMEPAKCPFGSHLEFNKKDYNLMCKSNYNDEFLLELASNIMLISMVAYLEAEFIFLI